MSRDLNLLEALDALGIVWELHEHEAVFTVDESDLLHDRISGTHTKNLFLKDAKKRFFLVTVPHDARVDLKALPSAIGSRKLSFGKAEDMERLLGVTPGSVTPLAAINDRDREVAVVIDQKLADAELVNVHPLRNTATISLAGSDLILALKAWGGPPQIVSVPAPA